MLLHSTNTLLQGQVVKTPEMQVTGVSYHSVFQVVLDIWQMSTGSSSERCRKGRSLFIPCVTKTYLFQSTYIFLDALFPGFRHTIAVCV